MTIIGVDARFNPDGLRPVMALLTDASKDAKSAVEEFLDQAHPRCEADKQIMELVGTVSTATANLAILTAGLTNPTHEGVQSAAEFFARAEADAQMMAGRNRSHP
ncbi:hypothetical protein [Micromonospora sp. NPDC049274]|uniref:hypothetical protein n=1 Tax=Micromonospora sp. NPDC049274 TaxID=3154829 RepID=UPI0034314613